MIVALVSLRAPIAVPVELRAAARRVFRLAEAVGEDGIRLARGASFEPGRPVDVRFDLPDGGRWALRATVAGADAEDDEVAFVDPPADAREAIRRYVHGRLGLPV
jgi:PilZ domain